MPPKPKGGVPMAEKRRRLLAIFKELGPDGRPTIYSLKELESKGNKCGVPGMQIKDIINDMVGDKLVDTEKIGSGNFYWALPSKAGQRMRQGISDITSQINREEAKLIAAMTRNDALQAGRTLGKARDKKLAALSKINEEKSGLESELQKHHDRDPAVLMECKEETEKLFDNINRWGDNLYQVRQYVQDSMHVESERFDEMFETCEADCEAVGWKMFGIDM